MMTPDDIGRTLKIELDDGRATSREDAERIAKSYRIGIRLGRGFETSCTATAAALTAINSAARAFRGGVFVEADTDVVVTHGWGLGRPLPAVLEALGASCVEYLPNDLPFVISIHEPGTPSPAPTEARVLYATWDGWAAGVVLDSEHRRGEDDDQPLAGALAGALAVSDAFQSLRGLAVADRRSIGISLWRPELDWLDAEARGPAIDVLPQKLWILGLGHLGQAYAWSLGCLPYPADALTVGLVDPQFVVKANVDTGLLTSADHVGSRKTRVVATALEARGAQTLIVERRFDHDFKRTPDEPAVALAGFDSPGPRRLLEGAGLARVVDAGLGGGPQQYVEMLIHVFPSGLSAVAAFEDSGATNADELLDRPAYATELARLEAGGLSNEAARCGVIEVAGRTVGAAFVGAIASTFVVADELRALADGPRYEVISLSLRSPEYMEAIPNSAPGPYVNPGFVRIR